MLSRLIIRLISNWKSTHLYYDSPSLSNEKICRAFIISPNTYGSCRPSPLIYRSDSLFSHSDFIFQNEQLQMKTSLSEEHIQTNNKSLLEHYLQTYNPLKIDLTNVNQGTVTTSIAKHIVSEETLSDTDTRPIANCYALNCTNKQIFSHGGRYVRLQEQENSSTAVSLVDERLSECSTKLTSLALPLVMVTDCSNGQRLHTEIIELSEDENDKK